jgi:hypothetical protein
MSIFKRLFGKADDDGSVAVADAPESDVECPHVILIAHWEDPNDMGNESRASSFRCESCHQVFTPLEAQMLRESESERLARLAEA